MTAPISSPAAGDANAGRATRSRSVPATYFDGRSAQARDVRIQLHGKALVVVDDRGDTIDHQAIGLVKVQEALRHAPQRIDLSNGATLIVTDKPRLAALLASAGIEPSFIERVQRSWVSVGCVLVALVAVLFCIYLWLLPWAASLAVRWLPASIEDRVAAQVWPLIDDNLFSPSALPVEQQQQIRAHFADVVAKVPDAPEYLLEFRAWQGGANAYAVPGGRIIVTDQMVRMARRIDGLQGGAPNEPGAALMGVLAHELGHVAYRHTLRTIIQGAAVSGVFALFFGDVSALTTAIPASLLTLRYSRDFERAADDYAVRSLKLAGMKADPLAALLRSFSSDPELAPQLQRFLSAHPVRGERIQRILEQADKPIGTPRSLLPNASTLRQ